MKDTRSGQVVRLTDNTGISSFASAWSPDGTRLAFDSNRDGDQEIYTMNSLDGSRLTKLTDNQNHDGEPTWSPDGTKIAFCATTTSGLWTPTAPTKKPDRFPGVGRVRAGLVARWRQDSLSRKVRRRTSGL